MSVPFRRGHVPPILEFEQRSPMILSSHAYADDGAKLAGPLVRPILALGHPTFADALLNVAHVVVGADLVSAFSIDEDCKPHYRRSRRRSTSSATALRSETVPAMQVISGRAFQD